ncbi:hypothetical protein TNCV_1906041 [Trichonephila clavipes]|nr:hypothetical protein TNCV_1906041 [Trichonephila clavipes]
MRKFWRGVSEWQKEGLHLSSASDQACKLYDAALSQAEERNFYREKKKRWIMEYYERLWSIMKDYGVL